jgi:hypothetical protein
MATSLNAHEFVERRDKSTAQKQIKNTERTTVFRKNQKVPLTTPETLSQRVIGVTKKSKRAKNLDNQRSVHLFSTNQFPINPVRVNSGNINVIS